MGSGMKKNHPALETGTFILNKAVCVFLVFRHCEMLMLHKGLLEMQ